MTSLGFRFSSPSPPAPCSSLKPCWPALRVGPACKMAPARMLMMLSRRAAWNAQKPSLCWGFPAKTRVFGTLARRAAPRRPGEKRRSHEARSAALCARPLLLRSRPFMARALAGHQKGRAALPDLMAAANAADPKQDDGCVHSTDGKNGYCRGQNNYQYHRSSDMSVRPSVSLSPSLRLRKVPEVQGHTRL